MTQMNGYCYMGTQFALNVFSYYLIQKNVDIKVKTTHNKNTNESRLSYLWNTDQNSLTSIF